MLQAGRAVTCMADMCSAHSLMYPAADTSLLLLMQNCRAHQRSAAIVASWMLVQRTSRTLLVDAYRLAGCSTRSLSLKGCFMLSPYTELEDAYTTTCESQ